MNYITIRTFIRTLHRFLQNPLISENSTKKLLLEGNLYVRGHIKFYQCITITKSILLLQHQYKKSFSEKPLYMILLFLFLLLHSKRNCIRSFPSSPVTPLMSTLLWSVYIYLKGRISIFTTYVILFVFTYVST